MTKWKVGLLGAVGAWMMGIALTGQAVADEVPLVSPWRYSGFGTVGLVTDNNGEISTSRDINRSAREAQYYRDATIWTMDTRIGGQVEYRINPDAELVGQAVWRDQPRNDIDKTIELAYVAWRPAPNVSMRLGRINYDAFLMSDHRNVGYAYTWVRPPIEFYSWIPMYSIDGIDAAWDVDDESGRWRIKAQGGASKQSVAMGGAPKNIFEFAGNNLHGISVTRT
ncbi:MAG TPA: hypothetical protein VJ001_11055, partial [Rhodocyclaceae bacterium]|nr:hypothetical protein [Rhodocyclaceae bacterium]